MYPAVFEDVAVTDLYHMEEKDFKGRNVLDAGANVGIFSIIACAAGARTVVAIKPNSDSFSRLVRNCRPWQNIHPLRFAVHDGTQAFCRTVGVGQECMVELSPSGDVPVVTLRQAAALFPPSDNDALLKMDIEGAEFEALQHDGAALRRFRTVMLETHCPANPPRVKELRSFVIGLGYDMVSCVASCTTSFKNGEEKYADLGMEICKFERIGTEG